MDKQSVGEWFVSQGENLVPEILFSVYSKVPSKDDIDWANNIIINL